MASSVKNQLRIKRATNKKAKYKLTYRKTSLNSNDNGNLSYTSNKSVSLAYKGY